MATPIQICTNAWNYLPRAWANRSYAYLLFRFVFKLVVACPRILDLARTAPGQREQALCHHFVIFSTFSLLRGLLAL